MNQAIIKLVTDTLFKTIRKFTSLTVVIYS